MSLLDNLPHTCTIRRRRRANTGMGGGKDTPVVEATGVACWEQQLSSKEAKEFEKRDMQIDRKVYFVTDRKLTERHEIIITARRNRDGTTTLIPADEQIVLDVRSRPAPDSSAGLAVLWKVMVQERTGESPPPDPE